MEDLNEFFGTFSLVLFSILISIYPLKLMVKYIKKDIILKYIKIVLVYIRKYHIILSTLAFIVLLVHIVLVSKNHSFFDLNYIFKDHYIFGYLATLTLFIPYIFGLIFKYFKKSQYIIKIHIYSSILFLIFMLLHIVD